MNALSDAIQRLLDSPAALPSSSFSLQQRKALETFSSSTRLIEIARQGRSTLYRVINPLALSNYLAQLQPVSETDLPPDLPDRSRNVGINRSSKKGNSTHQSYYLLMKAWADGVIWQDERTTLDVTAATSKFGIAALRLNADQSWRCNRTLLFVENQALFDRNDWLDNDFNGCLIYYAGQLPEFFLQWLSECSRSPQVILFPDYDGIGLSNYARLAKSLHAETKLDFYWMPNWQDKLMKYGDKEIWSRTSILFHNAYNQLKLSNLVDKDLEQLAEISQYHGKALEQEAIWL
ncbi:hypothetical protein [Methylobacter sp. BlB1]|uniref:hypothetical protein n=1 Tax=unclassified Methylobacter TaxID=2635283 RepID=UPI0018933577|nr:hypothetical protein [Methylobacter sp. BlB1]MBF6650096.1 hypothetical protein [Methylobacter sp. BlB1]